MLQLVIHGGASSLLNIKEAINKGADAVALASMLHYKAIGELKQDTSINEEEGNRSFLMRKGKRQIYTSTIQEIKDFLNSSQISIRKFL